MALFTTIFGYLNGVGLLLAIFFVVTLQALTRSDRLLDWLLKFLCRAIPVVFGCRVRVTGQLHVQGSKSYVFMSNHVNLFDPVILFGHIPNTVRGVELEDHFSWPLWGPITRRAGTIPISHRHVGQAVLSLKRAAESLRQGTSILILPEGHRTRDGQMGTFMRGPFRLAREAGADIVPVALRDAFTRKNVHTPLVHPGTMVCAIGKPIAAETVAAYSERELRDTVRMEIQKLLEWM